MKITRSKRAKIYVMKGKEFRGLKIDPKSKLLEIPWIVSTSITVRDALIRLDEVALNTLIVVDESYTMVGVITPNAEFAKGCKGGAKNCQQECDSACVDRGGCAFILWDPWGGATKCRWECNDQFDELQDEGIGMWF